MDSLRNKAQEEALRLAELYENLSLEWATGLGKSRASLNIAQKYGGKWYIVCAESKHIENWKQEIKKYGYELDVEIFCYASLHKFVNTRANIILDEYHHLTPARFSLVRQIQYDRIIALSATPDKRSSLFLHRLGAFHHFTISMRAAIDKGLPEPKILVYKTSLDDKVVNQVFSYREKKKDSVSCPFNHRFIFMKNYPNHRIDVHCTERQKYDIIEGIMESTDSDMVKKIYGLKRKNLLASVKTRLLRQILVKHADKRLVCFLNTIKQAKEIGIPGTIIHSDVRHTDAIIKKFNDYEIDKLFSVRMIREGQNLEKPELVILTQLDRKIRTFIQTLGRAVRHTEPFYILLVVEDTVDETFLENSISGLENFVNEERFDEVFIRSGRAAPSMRDPSALAES